MAPWVSATPEPCHSDPEAGHGQARASQEKLSPSERCESGFVTARVDGSCGIVCLVDAFGAAEILVGTLAGRLGAISLDIHFSLLQCVLSVEDESTARCSP